MELIYQVLLQSQVFGWLRLENASMQTGPELTKIETFHVDMSMDNHSSKNKTLKHLWIYNYYSQFGRSILMMIPWWPLIMHDGSSEAMLIIMNMHAFVKIGADDNKPMLITGSIIQSLSRILLLFSKWPVSPSSMGSSHLLVTILRREMGVPNQISTHPSMPTHWQFDVETSYVNVRSDLFGRQYEM